jgi:hypothetical protein
MKAERGPTEREDETLKARRAGKRATDTVVFKERRSVALRVEPRKQRAIVEI